MFIFLLHAYVDVLINSHKVDRLKLQSAKLQPDAAKCALQLSCLFSEELVNGNPSGTTARDEVRKQKLDPVRMNYIIGTYIIILLIDCSCIIMLVWMQIIFPANGQMPLSKTRL